jgi:hypothetical protein
MGESYGENFLAVSSHAMAIRTGHRGRAIWHRATSFFGGLWNFVSMPTNHNKQFLSSRRRFDVSLAKLSRNYALMSSRVSSKELKCASRIVGDICRILCSTINRSVCTLYWNKNISTFLINGAFYYKIKSCALVGTLPTSKCQCSFCVHKSEKNSRADGRREQIPDCTRFQFTTPDRNSEYFLQQIQEILICGS